MSRKLIRLGAILAILIISIGTTRVALAGQAAGKLPDLSIASASTAQWFTGWADKSTSTNVGSYPSVAYSPADGLPYISYYDAVNHHLMLASPEVSNAADNTCLHTNWYCRVVDGNGINASSSDSVGQYSSIAFWQGGSTWKLGISYHDSTINALKYAEYSPSYTLPSANHGWKYYTIDSSASAADEIGTYSSLKFANDGTPRIAYYKHYLFSPSLWEGQLMVAMPLPDGHCGPGGNTWKCDFVDGHSGVGVGKLALLDVDYAGKVHIVYYDEENSYLKYADYAGSGIGDCQPGFNYDCQVVESGVTIGVAALTAARTASDTVHIAYYDKTNGNLVYAAPVTSGGTCAGSGGLWSCAIIHSMGAGILQPGLSMASDKNGGLIIAYEDATDDQSPAMLSIARPRAFGNCGPQIYMPPIWVHIWQCDVVDNASFGQGHASLASYTSVAVNQSTGLATIAYMDQDDTLGNSLRVAYQRLLNFLPFIKR